MIINSELINPYANLEGEAALEKTKELYIETKMMDWDKKRLASKNISYEDKLEEIKKSWDDYTPERKQEEV